MESFSLSRAGLGYDPNLIREVCACDEGMKTAAAAVM